MKNIFAISVCLLVVLIASTSLAQKKIVILGSSTAAGNGSTVGNSWAARLQASFQKNTSDGLDTVIDNRAYPGYVTYKGMPDDYSMPPDRTSWSPDPFRNVTWIINQVPRPDIAILSYVSNDVNLYPNYTKKETMDNLRLMYQRLNAAGIRCFVSSTQPRNDMSDAQRLMLRELRDSIINEFGVYSIVFWDDLVTNDGLNRLKDEVNSGDGIHPNDLGHLYIFQRVQAKNIFSVVAGPLPLVLKDWQVSQESNAVKLKWRTSDEEPNSFFEIQRSVNGRDFEILHKKTATGRNTEYTWSDLHPLPGKNFYRLKIIEPAKTSYSKIMTVDIKEQLISKLYSDASNLYINISSRTSQDILFTILSHSGAVVKKKKLNLANAGTQINIPIAELPAGQYFLQITSTERANVVQSFMKLK